MGFYSSHSTGFFIKNESAKKIGKYNLKYKYHADYDYFYRMIVKNKMHGISTKKHEILGYLEEGVFQVKFHIENYFMKKLKSGLIMIKINFLSFF